MRVIYNENQLTRERLTYEVSRCELHIDGCNCDNGDWPPCSCDDYDSSCSLDQCQGDIN